MPIILVVIIRSTIAFFALLVLIRIIGKQQVSQLTFFDYTVGITIGSMASTLSIQLNENLTSTLAGMVTWTVLAILVAIIGIHSARLEKIVVGEPEIVIQNGKIVEENLKKNRITISELLSELRVQGVFNIEDVEFALIEPDGKISVQKKSQKQPVTPSDLNLPTQYDGLPTVLIIDGVVQESALRSINLTKAWLYHQLEKQNIKDTEIFLAQLDTKGNLYVDLKEDNRYFIIDTTN
ncbi:DUF421 domain-containing protein [Acetivibrio clariflavus]|uniref:Putative membrane protein n=1 Tax=Acetivibrio clariflavus (strain DSM 19732 / NBRC 101661 / EBR45) TaxID=720554 RepID=G8M2Z8_ACECE|nr:DUF421 domain-containing protein [Acetivibrio clariflavus]AEV69307.1 putative membrane protein [Acetivibrio clariflavus DSM 19732]